MVINKNDKGFSKAKILEIGTESYMKIIKISLMSVIKFLMKIFYLNFLKKFLVYCYFYIITIKLALFL